MLCRYSIKNLPFSATIVIYNINNVYALFLINWMFILMDKKCAFPSKTRTFLSDPNLWTIVQTFLIFLFIPHLDHRKAETHAHMHTHTLFGVHPDGDCVFHGSVDSQHHIRKVWDVQRCRYAVQRSGNYSSLQPRDTTLSVWRVQDMA